MVCRCCLFHFIVLFSLKYIYIGSAGHAILYVVERTDKEKYRFTVVNTGEGISYHLQRPFSSKIKYQTAACINNISIERITDQGWW